MLANPGRRWWVLPLPARLTRQLRSVSSGVVRLSNEYCGKGWRRQSSLHPRSLGYEERRGLVRIGIPRRRILRFLPCECVVGRMVGIRGTKVAPLGSPPPLEVAGGRVVVVVGVGVVVIVVVVSFHPNVRLRPAGSGQTGRRA